MLRSSIRSHFGKAALLAGISTLAMTTGSTGVFAQTAAVGASEEIVVTAQRRSERLIDVPITIQVQSREDLERSAIVNIRELMGLVPGVLIQGSGLNTAPAIRGVFSVQSDPGNDGNIAIYVDDVYMASQIANNLDLPDIERIEVLKGPQGTLFGRNAAGGAIRIYTVRPDLNDARGQAKIGYGSFNEVIASGYVTGPIVEDKLAASFSAHYMQSDGWSRDVVNNNDSGGKMDITLRTKFLFQPTDDLSIELQGSYNRHYDNDVQSYAVLNGNTIARRLYPGVVIPTKPGEYAQDAGILPDLKHLRYTAGATVTYATEWGDLSAMGAYTHTHAYFYSDADITAAEYTQVPATQKHMDIQAELLFSSKRFAGIQVTAGAFYYTSESGYQPLVLSGPAFGGFTLYGWSRNRTNSYSVFGEANYELTDRLTVIAGVRYNTEKRTADSAYGFSATYPSSIARLGRVKYKATTPRATIRYRLTEENDNVYFTYSEGFKAGLFNISGSQPPPVEPETVQAYEIGLKTSPSRMFSANIAAFYYDYTNQQVKANTGTTNITLNAASSRIYGAEADIRARLTDEFTLAVNFAVLDAKYTSFPGAAALAFFTGPGCDLNCGYLNVVADYTGTRQPRSPKFSAGVNANYTRDYSFGNVSLSANFYFTSAFSFYANNGIPQSKYATLGLTAQYTPTDSPITFTAWGKNLTDSTYIYSAFQNGNGDGVSYWPGARGGFSIKYAF